MKTILMILVSLIAVSSVANAKDVEGEAQRWAGRQCRDQAGKKDKFDLCVKRKIKELQDEQFGSNDSAADSDADSSRDAGNGSDSQDDVGGDATLD